MPELHLTPRDVAELAAMRITLAPATDREKYIQQRIVSHALEERLSQMKEVLKAEAMIARWWKYAALVTWAVVLAVVVWRWWAK